MSLNEPFSSGEPEVVAAPATPLPSWRDRIPSPQTPDELFNALLVALGVTIVALRSHKNRQANDRKRQLLKKKSYHPEPKPKCVASLQRRFLPVFWLLRLSFWMSGPYFYQAYASKTFDGKPATQAHLSQIFLAGYLAIAVLGPSLGRVLDTYGRKRGTLLAAAVYGLGALSTSFGELWMLMAGRAVGGLGTNLLSSAPEGWMVGEALGSGRSENVDEETRARYLSETFGLAYSYDPVVAILSGQIAGWVARRAGPTGPFLLLPVFLAGGSAIAMACWEENTAAGGKCGESGICSIDDAYGDVKDDETKRTNEKITTATVREGMAKIWGDKKLLVLGGAQSLFEGSMNIFLTQWPPAMTKAVARKFGDDALVPFGTVFSCFMACSMVGTTLYTMSLYTGGLFLERKMMWMHVAATLSLAGMTYAVVMGGGDLYGLTLGMFAYEACVGMYFPMMGTMRSKYLPASHRGIITSIFAMVLNVFVVTVFMLTGRLGTGGALALATLALAASALCLMLLRRIRSREARANLKRLKKTFKWKILAIAALKQCAASAERERKKAERERSLKQMKATMSEEEYMWYEALERRASYAAHNGAGHFSGHRW